MMHYMHVGFRMVTLKQASVSTSCINQSLLIKCIPDIADVSYFVLPENPMDVEAAARSTTVYLVDKRIDMLPSLLGTNLCSLRPNVERLAFSVIWVRKCQSQLHICSWFFRSSAQTRTLLMSGLPSL